MRFSVIGKVDSIPTLLPATAIEEPNGAVLTGTGTLDESEQSNDTGLLWLHDALHLPQNWTQSLRTNTTILAVSDGSYKQEHGTAAWILQINETCEIQGEMITPGNKGDQSAY
jgi:hypothetical protein